MNINSKKTSNPKKFDKIKLVTSITLKDVNKVNNKISQNTILPHLELNMYNKGFLNTNNKNNNVLKTDHNVKQNKLKKLFPNTNKIREGVKSIYDYNIKEQDIINYSVNLKDSNKDNNSLYNLEQSFNNNDKNIPDINYLKNNYNKYVKSMMDSYEYSSNYNNIDKKKILLSKTILDTLSNNKTKLYSKNNINRIKVKLEKPLFKNPIDSYLTLKTNKSLENKINYNILRVQEIKNMHFIEKFKEIDLINKYDQSKLKVSNIAPSDLKKPRFANQNLNNNINLETDQDINIKSSDMNINNKKPNFNNNTKSPDYEIDNKLSSISNYLLGQYIYPKKGDFPPGRYLFSLTINSNNLSEAYLYGGIEANCTNNYVYKLDLSSLNWKILENNKNSFVKDTLSNAKENKTLSNNTNDKKYFQNQRFGHTSIFFDKKMYVFGGVVKTMDSYYYPDIEILDPVTCKFDDYNCNSRKHLKFRKHHIAHIVGQYMLINGGISEDNNYLNDIFVLDIPNMKWYEPQIKVIKSNFNENKNNNDSLSDIDKTYAIVKENENKSYKFKHKASIYSDNASEKQQLKSNNNSSSVPCLAYHSSCVVLPESIILNNHTNIFKFPNLDKRSFTKPKEKGIYIFGGKFGPGVNNISNDLYCLRIGKKEFEWILIETQGKKPEKRYLSSITFIENQNIIFIHGGKNDSAIYYNNNKLFDMNLDDKDNINYNQDNYDISNNLNYMNNESNTRLFIDKDYKLILKKDKSSKNTDKSLSNFKKDNNVLQKSVYNKEDISTSFNDFWALDLARFEWIQIEIYSNSVNKFSIANRFGHQILKNEETIIIFGGMNESVFLGSCFLKINLSKFYYNN